MTCVFETHRRRGNSRSYIDAYSVRNIAAFINFSCRPNLEMQSIEGSHRDRKLPRIAFYAKEDIQAGT